MTKTILIILISFILLPALGQNPSIEIIFRFNELSDSIIRVKTRDYYPQEFSNVKKNVEYKYRFNGILGHQKVDTIRFLHVDNEVMLGIIVALHTQLLCNGQFVPLQSKHIDHDTPSSNRALIHTFDKQREWLSDELTSPDRA